MLGSLPGQGTLSLIQLAQYLGGLTIHHDVWAEAAQALHRLLKTNLVAFAERGPGDEILTHHWVYSETDLGQDWAARFQALATPEPDPSRFGLQMRRIIRETLDGGFLASRQFDRPSPLALAFLPITREDHENAVMLVGLDTAGPLSNPTLDFYLAVAGLVGTTVARLSSERQLRDYRQHLERLVERRTAELSESNRKLKQEIEERRKAEEALRKSQARLMTIIEQAPVMINSFADDGRCLMWNEECVKRLGWTWEEVRDARMPLALFHPDPADQARTRQAMTKADGRFGERTLRARDGAALDQVWADFRLPDGSLISLGYDVTERKRAEQALVESEGKYRALVDNAQEAILILREGRVAFVNPAGLGLTGLTPEELLDQPLRELIHPEDHAHLRQLSLHGAGVSDAEANPPLRLRSRQGRELWLRVNAVAIEWQGQPAILVIARDVSRELEVESRLRQSHKMEAIGTLAGGIAHEFNNILGVVAGYCELALPAARKGKATIHELEQIQTAADRAKSLVRQILAFSRKMEPRLQVMDINGEIRGILEMVKPTLPRMIATELDLADNLGWVKTDPIYIQQMLMNLCANAADAMPQGGRLHVTTREVSLVDHVCTTCGETFSGRFVLLQVADDGEGIAPETMAKIFDPFFTTKQVGSGTGLGLATVFGVVREHHGHVLCQSRVGEGSVFSIYLPAVEPGPRPPRASRPAGPAALGRQRLVLLVDDEAQFRQMTGEMLERAGFRVMFAANGEEALAHYGQATEKIDLVILDLSMPGMGGHRCLRELLLLDPKVKVLIASGYSAEGRAEDALEQGAAGFIAKPFRSQALFKAIADILNG